MTRLMRSAVTVTFIFWIAIALAQGTYRGGRIVVKPTFYLVGGAPTPSVDLQRKLIRHLALAQQRFLTLLDFSDTFELDFTPKIFRSPSTVDQVTIQPNGGAEFALKQLMESDSFSRWTCPYVYVIVFVGTSTFPPGSGGRPINGGHNNGGGIIILSAEYLANVPNIQSTLQHELGHAFGLVHVDEYGYDMNQNPSIMSYNLSHNTKDYRPSAAPGRLIPEDLRGLGLNKNAFPKFNFVPRMHIPADYGMKPDVVLAPMELDSPQ